MILLAPLVALDRVFPSHCWIGYLTSAFGFEELQNAEFPWHGCFTGDAGTIELTSSSNVSGPSGCVVSIEDGALHR